MKITDKKIKKVRLINESIEKVWWRWTTHEGLKSFFGRDNKIELTPGGAFEIYFMMDSPVGLRGSEGCQILSYLPNEMLSFSWNAPPKYEEVRKSDHKTWTVVNYKAESNHQTEITLTQFGWPDDEQWNAVFDYFDIAWDQVLDVLEKVTEQ